MPKIPRWSLVLVQVTVRDLGCSDTGERRCIDAVSRVIEGLDRMTTVVDDRGDIRANYWIELEEPNEPLVVRRR
jgi:hypothetical protein